MGDFDDAAAEIIDALGEPFVYFDHTELREIDGIFSNAFQKVQGSQGPAIGSRRPELQIVTDVVTEPKAGDRLFRGERTAFTGVFDYEVVSVRDDEEETVRTLILKKAN